MTHQESLWNWKEWCWQHRNISRYSYDVKCCIIVLVNNAILFSDNDQILANIVIVSIGGTSIRERASIGYNTVRPPAKSIQQLERLFLHKVLLRFLLHPINLIFF